MADSDLDNAGVKAVITLGVLAFVGILAIVIAKIVQYCVNKHYTDDDGGHIDENTRALIRARLSVVQFKKREIKKAQQEKTLNIFTKWKEFARSKQKDREAALKSQRPQGNGQVVITIDKLDELDVKENGVLDNDSNKIQENGTARIPRFPFFAHTKTAGGGVKPHTEAPRNAPLIKTNTVKPETPVPRGRPVSSKHISPNVTVTDMDINGSTKVLVKSVHFEDDSDKVKSESVTDNASNKNDPKAEKKSKVKSNANADKKVIVKGKENNGKKDELNNDVNTVENINVKSNTINEKNEKVNTKVTGSTYAEKENNESAEANAVIQHDATVVIIREGNSKEDVTTKTELENKSGEKT